MGAVTALMYSERDLNIGGMVLDSPFSDLKLLVKDLAKTFLIRRKRRDMQPSKLSRRRSRWKLEPLSQPSLNLLLDRTSMLQFKFPNKT